MQGMKLSAVATMGNKLNELAVLIKVRRLKAVGARQWHGSGWFWFERVSAWC